MRPFVVLLVAATFAACSDSTGCASTAPCASLRSTASSVAGSWKETQTWRNISLQVSLAASDTTLAGSATYDVTGGAAGTANVTGYVFWQDSAFVPSGHVVPAHAVVVLDFAFDNGTSAHFDQGALSGQNALSGALTFSDDASASYGTTFVRAGP